MKRLLIFLLTTVASAQVSAPVWTQHSPGTGPPAFAGWGGNIPWYDTLSMQMGIFAQSNASTQGGIYSTNFTFANIYSGTPQWDLQPGATAYTNDTAACAATNNANQPKPRHPYPGFPILDNYRRIGVLLGGSCAGGFNDMVYFTRHQDIANNNGTFTVISPGGGTYPNCIQFCGGVYDSGDDIYVVFGYDNGAGQNLWIYCNTIPIGGGSATGTLTAAQVSYGGCSSKDTWLNITSGTQPPNAAQLGAGTLQNPSLVYDPVIGKVLSYGGTDANSTFYSNQLWAWTPSTNSWVELCGAGCTPPPAARNGGIAAIGGIVPIVYDQNRGYIWVHVQVAASGAPADCWYKPSTDRWTCYNSNGGETDPDTGIGYDPIADRLMTVGLLAGGTTFSDVWVSARIGGRSFLSGTGAPSSGTGNDGDIYHRTDVPSIYGPKLDGSWPSTYSYITGVGCNTAYHIDKDCDGYGIYPTNMTQDPNPLLDVDADDNDATVNTSASVITKYGSINSFLTHLGYPTGTVVYIDPVNGSDSTGAGTSGNPYKSWDPVISGLSYVGSGAGNTTLLFRAGISGLSGGSNSHLPYASSPSSPIVVMAYPGERVVTTALSGNTNFAGASDNIIYDGFTLKCGNTGFGNGYDGNHQDGITLKNMEMSGCGHNVQIASGGRNFTIDNSVLHDSSSHSLYPTSAGLYSPTQFNCSTWVWDTTGFPSSPSGNNPFNNLILSNSLVYNAGTGGLEAVHLNAYICGGGVIGNNIHNNGGTGLGLQTGVQGFSSGNQFMVENNVIGPGNQSAAITMSIYGCDNNGSAATMAQFMMGGTCFGSSFSSGVTYYPGFFDYVSIINNTLWTGQYATQGGGECDPTNPGAPGGQCTIPSFGIYELDYSVGTPDSKWLKNTTIQNNLILTYNTGGGGQDQLFFQTNSFPDTNLIKNNMFYNLAPGTSQSALMNISAGAQSSFPGTYTFTTFQSYNTGNNANNLFADPLFVDTALGYYATPNLFNAKLTGSSPAIGVGLHTGAPTLDLQGLTRGNPPSIGAYEFTGGGGSTGGSVTSGSVRMSGGVRTN